MRKALARPLCAYRKQYYIIVFFLVSLSVTTVGQSREFLFNSGVNYLLADKVIAIDQFTKAIEIDPNFSAAYFYRGVAEFKLGQYKKAIKDFSKVNELDSTVKIVHAYKGFAYRQLGDSEKSLAAFSKYMNSQDKLSALDYRLIGKAKMEVGDVDGAIKDFESALNKNNGESEHYYLYLALFSNEKYKEALTQINLAIDGNREFYGYFLHRGNTKLMLGDFNNALADYDYALHLEPSIPDSYFLRGRALDTLRRHDLAIVDFTRAIDLNPNDGTYYSKRGNARFANGNRDAACLDWTIAGNLGYYEDFDKIKSLCD
jgi:tetratricopeptide (TPR) repeat protein